MKVAGLEVNASGTADFVESLSTAGTVFLVLMATGVAYEMTNGVIFVGSVILLLLAIVSGKNDDKSVSERFTFLEFGCSALFVLLMMAWTEVWYWIPEILEPYVTGWWGAVEAIVLFIVATFQDG